ncbi:MAG: DUF2141 domain-containing protein [Phenylobacterium sp.]
MKSATTAALALSLALVGGTVSAAECEGKPSATQLTIEVTGVRAARGQMAITIYPDVARRFLAPKGKLARVRVVSRAPVTSACFWLPQPGFYAVAVYHDANGDEDFNRSLVGLPTEGFGFSNDAPTPTGLPPFQAVRFRVPAGESTLKVKLRYLR